MKELRWQKEKPDYACIFLTKQNGEYNLWRFTWEHGEAPDGVIKEDESVYYYLAWSDNDGGEWDDINECDFDEYLILEELPTQEEVHKEWIKSMIDR